MKSKPAHMQLNTQLVNCAKVVLISLAVICFIMPYDVYAACSATGLFTLGGGTGKCVVGQKGMLVNILCTFENTLSSVLATMYCAFQTQLKDPVATTISIFIAVFGVCVFTGYIDMSVRDASMTITKLAVVWAMAMNSDYGILWIGKFFIGILQEGSDIALGTMGGNTTLTQPDSVIQGFFNFMSNPDPAQLPLTNNCGVGTDCMNATILKNFSACASYLMVVGVGLLAFMPVVMAFLLTVLLQYIGLYVRALLGYLTSIVILTFLMILAPLFLSFGLFSVTKKLFERWLQFLQTFSIQGIILFAFVAMLGLITQGFTIFFYGLMGLLRPYDAAMNVNIVTSTVSNACSICEYQITGDPATNMQRIKCLPAVTTASPAPHVITPNNVPQPIGNNLVTVMPNDLTGTPISYYPNPHLMLGDVLSSQVNAMPGDAEQDTGKNYVVPILNVLTRTDFVLFFVSNVIAFVVICSVFQGFIKRAPQLAKALGGVGIAAQLGGGRVDKGDNIIRYAGGEAASAGMLGMEQNMMRDPFNAKIGIKQRIMEGVIGRKIVNERLTGDAYTNALKDAPLTGGLLGGFLNGADENDPYSPHYNESARKEAGIKEAQGEIENANGDLKKSQMQLIQAGDELDTKRKEVELAEKTKSKTPKELADLKAGLATSAKKYEQAIENANLKREALRLKQQDLKQRYADMQSGKGRVRGAATQLDAKGNVIHGGMSDGEGRDELNEGYRTAALEDEKARIAAENKALAAATKRNANSTGSTDRTSGTSTGELAGISQATGKKIELLDKQMAGYGRFLSEDKRKEYQKAIEKAKKDLGNAKTAKEAQEIEKSLRGIEDTLDGYSSKNLMQGAAVAATAATAGALLLASKTATPTYLEPAEKELADIRANMVKANSEDSFSAMMDSINRTPFRALNAMIASADSQQEIAARIVPDATLKASAEKIDAAREESAKGKTPEEAFQAMHRIQNSSSELVSDVLGFMGYQRNAAGQMVPEADMTEFDKKMYAAREDANKATKGEHYEQILKDLMGAPSLLITEMTDGISKRMVADMPDMSPEQRQQANEKLREVRRSANRATSGDEYADLFQDLSGVSAMTERGFQLRTAEDDEGSRLQRTRAAVEEGDKTSVPGAIGTFGQRLKGAVPDVSNMHFETGSSILGTTTTHRRDFVAEPLPDAASQKKWDDMQGQLAAIKNRSTGSAIDPRYANYQAPKPGDKDYRPDSVIEHEHGQPITMPGPLDNFANRVKSNIPNFSGVNWQKSGFGEGKGAGVVNASDSFSHMGEVFTGAKDRLARTEYTSEATIMGAPVSGGIGGIWDSWKGRASAVLPGHAPHMQTGATFLGEEVRSGDGPRSGISGAFSGYKDRLGQTVPDFSNSHVEAGATVLGTQIKTTPEAAYVSQYTGVWNALSDDMKVQGVSTRIESAKAHYETVSGQLSIGDRSAYNRELASISADWATAKTEAEAKDIVHRLAVLEASYRDVLPDAQHEKAKQDIATIEKTMPATRNVIPPEHIEAMQQRLDSAKEELARAETPEHYDSALAKIQQAKDIQQGRADPTVADEHEAHSGEKRETHVALSDIFNPSPAILAEQEARRVEEEAKARQEQGASSGNENNSSSRDQGDGKERDDDKDKDKEDDDFENMKNHVTSHHKKHDDKRHKEHHDHGMSKVKRNDPCPCGSGMLYKNCHKKMDD